MIKALLPEMESPVGNPDFRSSGSSWRVSFSAEDRPTLATTWPGEDHAIYLYLRAMTNIGLTSSSSSSSLSRSRTRESVHGILRCGCLRLLSCAYMHIVIISLPGAIQYNEGQDMVNHVGIQEIVLEPPLQGASNLPTSTWAGNMPRYVRHMQARMRLHCHFCGGISSDHH